MKLQRYPHFKTAYQFTELAGRRVRPIPREPDTLAGPNIFSGMGKFVLHSNFARRFWCVYVNQGKLWLSIGNDVFRASEVSIEAESTFFAHTLVVREARKERRYKTLQPWIYMPWIVIDLISYDALDYEADSFPAFLEKHLADHEWRERVLRRFCEP